MSKIELVVRDKLRSPCHQSDGYDELRLLHYVIHRTVLSTYQETLVASIMNEQCCSYINSHDAHIHCGTGIHLRYILLS